MNDREAYILSIKSAEELVKNCGAIPYFAEDRAKIITQVERILFKEETIPSEFRQVSDLYIAKGADSLV